MQSVYFLSACPQKRRTKLCCFFFRSTNVFNNTRTLHKILASGFQRRQKWLCEYLSCLTFRDLSSSALCMAATHSRCCLVSVYALLLSKSMLLSQVLLSASTLSSLLLKMLLLLLVCLLEMKVEAV